MNENDRELIDRFLSHQDQEAFNELVRRHERNIRAVAMSVLGDTPDVDDVLQETLVLFIQKGHSLSAPERLSAWLHGVAWRVSIKAAQKRHRQTLEIESEGKPVSERDPVEQMELRQLVLSCVDNLPSNYRQVIERTFYKEESHDEIARKLNIPRGSIAGFLQRALSLLHNEIRLRNVSASVLAMVWVSAGKLDPLSAGEITALAANCQDETSPQSNSLTQNSEVDLPASNAAVLPVVSLSVRWKWGLATVAALAVAVGLIAVKSTAPSDSVHPKTSVGIPAEPRESVSGLATFAAVRSPLPTGREARASGVAFDSDSESCSCLSVD